MRSRTDAVASPLGLGAAAILLLTCGVARGQDRTAGFAIDRYDPADPGSDWFTLDSLDLRGRARVAIGAVADFARHPLVLYDMNDMARSKVLEQQLFGHLGVSLVLSDRMRVAASLPVALQQSGDAAVIDGMTYGPPEAPVVGDVRLGADVRLVGRYGGAFTAALGVNGHLPTGSRINFSGDGEPRIAPRILAAGDLGPVAWATRVGVNFRGQQIGLAGKVLEDELAFGAALGIRAVDRRLLIGGEVHGSVTVPDSTSLTRPVEVLGTVSWKGRNGLHVGAAAGPGLDRAVGTPELRVLSVIAWQPPVQAPPPPVLPAPIRTPEDLDGDGLPDLVDACPETKGPRSDDPKKNGCPPDRDGDGIPDAEDACRDVPGVRDDDPGKSGCPPDRDADGVADLEDACPDAPGPRSDDAKKNGCPPDKDADGVADLEDACPDVPGPRSDDRKKNGCPGDRDGDGFTDNVDACPDAAGPANADPQKNGCPLVIRTAEEIKILEQIKFRTGSARILADSDLILAAVVKILKDSPDIKKVRVEGHTDNQGKARKNKKLSNDRAKSVVRWLVKHGIAKRRLQAQGFGQDRPIDSNETDDGRRNNRRVEFHIVEKEGKP